MGPGAGRPCIHSHAPPTDRRRFSLLTDVVGVKHAAEEVLADGERAEDLRGGEGRVEEEARLGRGEGLGDEGREHQQVEAVDPDQVPLVVHLHHLVLVLLVVVMWCVVLNE